VPAVLHVTEVFNDGTDDDSVDQYARLEGRIIVGHDQNFMRIIQQKLYQFNIPVSSGYGRIMLCGQESRQPERRLEVLPYLDICHRWALETNRRFSIAIGNTWIRYDDGLISRTPKSERDQKN